MLADHLRYKHSGGTVLLSTTQQKACLHQAGPGTSEQPTATSRRHASNSQVPVGCNLLLRQSPAANTAIERKQLLWLPGSVLASVGSIDGDPPDFQASNRLGGKWHQLSIVWVATEAASHASRQRAQQLKLKVQLIYIRRSRKQCLAGQQLCLHVCAALGATCQVPVCVACCAGMLVCAWTLMGEAVVFGSSCTLTGQTVQYSTAWHSIAQQDVAQHSMVWHNTACYNTLGLVQKCDVNMQSHPVFCRETRLGIIRPTATQSCTGCVS